VNFEFKKSFAKDLKKKAKRIELRSRIQDTILGIGNAKNISEIKNLKKLKAEENNYRIRLGDYRIGLKIEDETVIFVRFLHRKEIYRYFP
jgi:mRNA interferase RelE/StbE